MIFGYFFLIYKNERIRRRGAAVLFYPPPLPSVKQSGKVGRGL